jgi:asparagine synthase (glutamine-hydrolysing)
MSGFAGEFVFAQAPADTAIARAMADQLTRRGPDQAGAFLSPDRRCAIACHRLAVIDPAASGQPTTSADGRLTVACDGWIANLPSLREELARRGTTLKTAGDAEVLLHMYARHGQALVEHLSGMFAFALYDSSTGRLLLARDHFGQKPLWYAMLGDRIAFASEAKALLAHPQVDKQTDCQAITAYLTMGYIPSPASAWASLRKLPPASCLLVSDGASEPQPYWAPQPAPLPVAQAELAEFLRDRIRALVARAMIPDTHIGALLSGGLDSSIVVALMRQVVGRTGGLRTFTVGFSESDYDERTPAAAVAKHCGTDHTELRIGPPAVSMVDDLVRIYDEPLADSSALATWLICREARRHVTVALLGDAGDEIFGGYDRYRALHLAATMSPVAYLAIRLAAAAAGLIAPPADRSRLRRLVRFSAALPHPSSKQYLMYRCIFAPDDLPRLLTDEFAGRVNIHSPAEWFCNLYEEGDFADEVARAQRHDMLTYVPDDLLVKTDMASMAVSMQLRAPLLDRELACIGLGLPISAKLNRRQGKLILRRAFADLLPPEILRRPKRGFGVPVSHWLRGPLLKPLTETLLDPALLRRRIFRPEAIGGLINDHVSGRGDHGHRLWALLILARWLARQA